jgi:ubiquinone/menaquinone biosynthesis C-methylase UbiE
VTAVRKTAWFAARALRKVAAAVERAVDAQTLAVQEGMSAYDMTESVDEQYYADQYWHWLAPEVDRIAAGGTVRAIEIGCGHGRMLLRLARTIPHASLIGVDVTSEAVEAARRKAEKQQLTNVEFHSADAIPFMKRIAPGTMDLVLMIEVSFFMPRFREAVEEAARVLRSGGRLIASFRSQYYSVLHAIRGRDWKSAQMAIDEREGEWRGSSIRYTWQTEEDVRAIIRGAGLALNAPLRAIGAASGIPGDPLDVIAQPSALRAEDRRTLMTLETAMAERYAGTARYILAVAAKP